MTEIALKLVDVHKSFGSIEVLKGISLEVQPGDFFVSPGSPGHAVMVLDVAVAGDGSRYGLVGQGFTPAQELHVLSGSDGNFWFPLPAGPAEFLDLPSWSPFPKNTARQFTAPSAENTDN